MKRKGQVSSLPANSKKLTTKNINITPETLVNDVKGLLSTGLLEGVQVTYKKGMVELSGIIKDLGYLCGCSLCNYSKVCSASEFEKHAREVSSNQNNHIFVKSGKSVYDLVKELSRSNYTLGSLGEVIEEKIGCPPNMKCFRDWKDSFLLAREELTSIKISEELQKKPELLDSVQTTSAFQQISQEVYSERECFTRKGQFSSLPANSKKLTTKNIKITPETLVNDVKGLLSTGLLEGVQVTYKKGMVELSGIIKDIGYLCGCSLCNYSKVCSASEFEKHAREVSSNQNNHIFVKSGKSVYDLVKELSRSNYTLGSLDEVIEEKIGCPPNMKCFRDWKDSFLLAREELTSIKISEELQKKPELLDSVQTTSAFQQISQEVYSERECFTSSQGPTQKSICQDSSTIDKSSSPDPATEVGFVSTPAANIKFTSTGLETESNVIPASPIRQNGILLENETKLKRRSHLIPDSTYFPKSAVCSVQQKTVGQDCSKRSYQDSSAIEKFSSPVPATEAGFVSTPAAITKFTSTGPETESIVIPASPVRQNSVVLENETKLKKRSQLTPDSTHFSKSAVCSVQQKTAGQDGSKRRDSDLHQLVFKETGLPDGSELAYCLKDKIILRGYKVKSGILCCCCNNKISPSQFESHAGFPARRQPYHNIYTSNGISLHELSVSLSQGEILKTVYTDDLCPICGDPENLNDLVQCDGCPKAFHADCLNLQGCRNGEWYCPQCEVKSGYSAADVVTSSPVVRPITRRLRCLDDELGGCVLCKATDYNLGAFSMKTIMICRQCEKEYHVGCLKDKGLCDLKEFPGMWFCCTECDMVYATLQKLVLNGPKIVPESLLSTSLKNAEKDVPGKFGVEVKWQLLSGKHQSSELLSKVAEMFQETFSPVVERGQNLIPAMVYGQDVAGQYYEGIYSAVLTVKSVVVSVGILRIFGRSLAELPLVTTPRGSEGKGYFRTLLLIIERMLSSMRIGVLVLPVADEEKPMWINTFGFTEMANERLSKYMREHPLLMFEKTTMLEKAVSDFTHDAIRDEKLNFSVASMEF